MIIKTVDSDSGHWYAQDGSPAYRIKGKNGVERNTTLRDAKSLNLVPSVTTILGIVAKPGLTNWLQQQVLLAALTLPRVEGESEENWLQRVMSDAKSTGREAADRGTRMHGELEKYFDGGSYDAPYYCSQVEKALDSHFGEHVLWESERSFAWNGFGGKVDLSAPNIVVDFKSKEGDLSKVTAYHEQIMQLAAYREGLSMPAARCANVYFNEQGDVKLVEHSESDLAEAYECFQYLLSYYRKKNKI
ncbi:hypothetical protein UFOVP20_8 [uncultured Caudovirales phage]|uniref:PD-(D/E)XK nuclease superfamily n=1 Tax=uncultured Caudovirales phage TaxID=2100421 RepID=A0A6J5KKX8_9CAUD|nr:hypothetical protein UFOVP20_8 [uncultured Caudovirales phage]